MEGTNLVRGDSWTIVLPDGWKVPETLENGTVYIDSADESKGIFITSWMLVPEDAPATPGAAAESFKDKDVQALQQMEGYVWRLVDERVDAPDTGVAVVIADHLADEMSTASRQRSSPTFRSSFARHFTTTPATITRCRASTLRRSSSR